MTVCWVRVFMATILVQQGGGITGLPGLSLIALAIAVVVGIVRNVNVGPLSIAIALVIAYYVDGVKIKELIAGYPVSLSTFHPLDDFHIRGGDL